MKKIIFILAVSGLAVVFSSCKKDHDLTVFHGKWESQSIELSITPEDPVLSTAVAKALEHYTMSRFIFGPGNEFREYRYIENREDPTSMTTGTCFYHSGYKGRYKVHDLIVSLLEFELAQDRLTVRFDLSEFFRDPNNLGIEDPKSHPFDKIEAVILHDRAEFDTPSQ